MLHVSGQSSGQTLFTTVRSAVAMLGGLLCEIVPIGSRSIAFNYNERAFPGHHFARRHNARGHPSM
jgi:hypothetical protein